MVVVVVGSGWVVVVVAGERCVCVYVWGGGG